MDNTIFELSDKLISLRDEKKRIEAELDAVKKEIDNTDYMLTERMATEELQNFTRDGFMFYLNTKTYASAAAGMKDDLFAALKDND